VIGLPIDPVGFAGLAGLAGLGAMLAAVNGYSKAYSP
jgi:hypothetical protein